MGDSFGEGYPTDGEGPVHWVGLAAFWIDTTAVTNAQFSRFVRETGYVSDAEQLGVSAVFHLAVDADRSDILHHVDAAPWWLAVRGACWRRPEGPRSTLQHPAESPVVHMSWNDADAYCRWAGKRLPPRRSGSTPRAVGSKDDGSRGETSCSRAAAGVATSGRATSRTTNTIDDGYLTTAPVKSYRPNGYGFGTPQATSGSGAPTGSPRTTTPPLPRSTREGPSSGLPRVMRGGSFLCHSSYCNRYRVAARSSNTPDSTSANVGFRCANG